MSIPTPRFAPLLVSTALVTHGPGRAERVAAAFGSRALLERNRLLFFRRVLWSRLVHTLGEFTAAQACGMQKWEGRCPAYRGLTPRASGTRPTRQARVLVTLTLRRGRASSLLRVHARGVSLRVCPEDRRLHSPARPHGTGGHEPGAGNQLRGGEDQQKSRFSPLLQTE